MPGDSSGGAIAIEAGYPRSRLQGGDVVLGIRASIGAAHVVPVELDGTNLSRGIARIVPGPQINAEYLVAYLRSGAARTFWQVAKQGTTFNEVSIETVRSLPVIVPPKKIQVDIVHAIDTQTAQLDHAVDAAEREMLFLRDYRARLIADVVTGKFDVREVGAPLPDEVEERESIEGLEALPECEEVTDDADLDSAPVEFKA